MTQKNFPLAIVLLTIPVPAFAYLDPGSGSMLIYFLMGAFASLFYYCKDIAYKLLYLISNKKVDKSLNNLDGIDILFHSEGGQYWNVFLPIIEELEKKGIRSAYYSQSSDDPGLGSGFKYLKTAFIGNSLSSFALLNSIKVKVFVSTTPQLDVMHWKRSKYVKYYLHVVHAPTDALMYRYYSFDHYDTILCSSQFQIDSIRELEIKRNRPKKEILKTGLTYYDILYRNKYKNNRSCTHSKSILIAPTWKKNNLLELYGKKIIVDISMLGYKVIIRPHPQSFINSPDLMLELQKESELNNLIFFDNRPSAEESMSEADLLISDISGIIFDFYFVYNKPIIAIASEISTLGQEAEVIKKTPWEFQVLNEIATVLNVENLGNLKEILIEKINDKEYSSIYSGDGIIFNYGRAGIIAAQQIIEKTK